MDKYARILDVSPQATDEEIHRAYRMLASTHHPDLGGDKDEFQKIQNAYEQILVLRKKADRDKRDKRKRDAAAAARRQSDVTLKRKTQSVAPGTAHGGQSVDRGTEPSTAQQRPATDPQPPRTQPARSGKERKSASNFLTRKLPLQNQTTLFILINTLDIFMTYILMQFGANEANPIANYFFQKYNIKGMIFFKLMIVAAVCVIAQIVATKSIGKGKNLLTLGSILVGAVVIYSVLLFVNKFM